MEQPIIEASRVPETGAAVADFFGRDTAGETSQWRRP